MSAWKDLLNPDIKAFIRDNQSADVRDLALKKPPDSGWPYPLILDQIKARQKAVVKIPAWLEQDDIIFPPSHILEQASSAATASYKGRLCDGKTFVDLTGGAGIDSFAFLNCFEHGSIVDHDKNASDCIEYNAKCFGLRNKVSVSLSSAEDFVKLMASVDLVFIDPQRRKEARKGLYRFEDCSPDILSLLPVLRKKAQTVMVKASPMLDIDQGIAQLGCVSAVHVLEWRGECKELVFILDLHRDMPAIEIPVTAVSLDDDGEALTSFSFTRQEEHNAAVKLHEPLRYLYEPSPAFMKAGAFKLMGERLGIHKLHAHTHLYTSDEIVADFPGKCFEILGVYSVQAKELPVQKANLAVRNFPQDVARLKKKLKLKDGGRDMLFACTLVDGTHALIHAVKHV